MTTITTKQGKAGQLAIDTKGLTATVTVDGVSHLLAFVRGTKVVIKNDMLINGAELNKVKEELGKFIKKPETGKKRK